MQCDIDLFEIYEYVSRPSICDCSRAFSRGFMTRKLYKTRPTRCEMTEVKACG